MARLSRNVSAGGRSQRSCCFWPMTSVICWRNPLARSFGVKPATETSPPVGCRSPASTFRVVVLPAPLGPRKPTRSPASMAKLTSSTAFTSSYLRWKSERSAARMPGGRWWTRYHFCSRSTRIMPRNAILQDAMADLGPDQIFELKLIFLREVLAGYGPAKVAYDQLRESGTLDKPQLDILRRFFHKLAGTAAAAELSMLGKLAGACETAERRWL